ncbi:MAG: hypothetical protein E7011_01405 [Alphaproteobacteria bacterium]|nr:hypothetical protein [Alphaproteobacteria bacterium]
MRYLILIIIFCCTYADTATLHVDDKTFSLQPAKYTAPSLHVLLNNALWHGLLTEWPINNTLHVNYNNRTYNLFECETVFQDTTNYTFDSNGWITGVPGYVYIKNTGTQYINTEHIPTLTTRTEIALRFDDNEDMGLDNAEHIFGCVNLQSNPWSTYGLNFGIADTRRYTLYPWLCQYAKEGGLEYCSVSYIIITPEQKTTHQTVVLDAKNSVFRYGDTVRSISPRTTTENLPMYVFAKNVLDPDAATTHPAIYSKTGSMYVYAVRIYEDDKLVKYLVPVPRCMRIGDTVAPENGLWDLIERKFYGPMGTGKFIWGYD